MGGRDHLAVAFFINWRKLLSARVNGFALAAFILLLGYFWVRDSFSTSFKAFLYLHPFLSLLFSQNMMSDEIASGALENVVFAGGRFRHYLLSKSALVGAAGIGVSLTLFLCLGVYGLATRQLGSSELGRFASGLLVGLYYVAAAGVLSFYLRAGSNVLFIILGQFVLLAGLLLSASQRAGLIERLTAPVSQGVRGNLEFLSVSLILPNITIARQSLPNLLGLAAATALLAAFEVWKVQSLEVRQK